MTRLWPLLPLVLFLIPGCDSSSPAPAPASEVTVQAVEIEQVAFQAPDGSPWDARSGPDYFFRLTGPGGKQLIRSGAVEDLTRSDLPVVPNGSETIDADGGPYTFTIYEEDLLGREEFARTREVGRVPFQPSKYAKDRPGEVTLSQGTERLTLRTVWTE